MYILILTILLPVKCLHSRTSLFGDKNKSIPEQKFGHSPSLDSSSLHLPSSFSGWRKSNRRLSCPGDNRAIAEASKKFERQKLEQIPLPEEISPPKSQKILSSMYVHMHLCIYPLALVILYCLVLNKKMSPNFNKN